MKFGDLEEARISPLAGKTGFRFRLQFAGGAQFVEFDADTDRVMGLMVALQKLQEFHKIPVPASLRPRKGRPALKVVRPET